LRRRVLDWRIWNIAAFVVDISHRAMMKNIFAVLFGIVVLVSNANDSPSY
jgi:hypothetical protein